MKLIYFPLSLKTLHLFRIIFLLPLFFSSCSNDDNSAPLSTEKRIISFSFLADENNALEMDITATINQETKKITAQVPYGTNVTELKPTIAISAIATINPDQTAQDFSNTFIYTVTAEDDSKQAYQVEVAIAANDDKQITAFSFLDDDHKQLDADIIATLDQTHFSITAQVPYGTDLTALKPTIAFSAQQIVPKNKEIQDFTEPVTYTVTAEDGSIQTYEVHISAPNNAKQITAFSLLQPDNTALTIDIEALLDQDNQTINVLVPYGTNLTALKPAIRSSSNSTVSPATEQAVDFTNPVTYTVTAEDGSTQNYRVTVAYSDYPVLAELLKQNPNNTIDWNLNDRTMNSWSGVTLTNSGRVQNLFLRYKNIRKLPNEIEYLHELVNLELLGNKLNSFPTTIKNITGLKTLGIGQNQLTSIPEIITSITTLESLDLRSNQLTGLPAQIGNLTNLVSLDLSGGNQLTGLPAQIANLANLVSLNLAGNSFDTFPPQINNLTKLTTLNLSFNALGEFPIQEPIVANLESLNFSGNQLTRLPEQIGNLTNLIKLNLNSNPLNGLPVQIGNLTNLEDLELTDCSLSFLPREMGNLSSLRNLYIDRNPDLNLIHWEICDLRQSQNLFIHMDPEVTFCGG